METTAQAGLARFYLNGSAMSGDRHLAEVVVDRARAAGLAGATILRGQGGFGARGERHGVAFDLSDDKPVVVEVVDAAEQLRQFVGTLGDLNISLVTLERVEVLRQTTAHRGFL